jgi:hypothetical protein
LPSVKIPVLIFTIISFFKVIYFNIINYLKEP